MYILKRKLGNIKILQIKSKRDIENFGGIFFIQQDSLKLQWHIIKHNNKYKYKILYFFIIRFIYQINVPVYYICDYDSHFLIKTQSIIKRSRNTKY